MALTKQELIAKIAESSEISKAQVAKVLDSLIETVTAELSADGEVALPGLGKFCTSKRAARTGRNPQTGATINIAAATIPAFKAGKALKDAVNK